MPVILTYDLENFHTQVKQQLISQDGYTDVMTGTTVNTGQTAETDLPDTTLYHTTKNRISAVQDIERVALAHNANLEKYVAFDLPWPAAWRGQTSRIL